MYIGLIVMIAGPLLIATSGKGFEENVINMGILFILCLVVLGVRVLIMKRMYSIQKKSRDKFNKENRISPKFYELVKKTANSYMLFFEKTGIKYDSLSRAEIGELIYSKFDRIPGNLQNRVIDHIYIFHTKQVGDITKSDRKNHNYLPTHPDDVTIMQHAKKYVSFFEEKTIPYQSLNAQELEELIQCYNPLRDDNLYALVAEYIHEYYTGKGGIEINNH